MHWQCNCRAWKEVKVTTVEGLVKSEIRMPDLSFVVAALHWVIDIAGADRDTERITLVECSVSSPIIASHHGLYVKCLMLCCNEHLETEYQGTYLNRIYDSATWLSGDKNLEIPQIT